MLVVESLYTSLSMDKFKVKVYWDIFIVNMSVDLLMTSVLGHSLWSGFMPRWTYSCSGAL